MVGFWPGSLSGSVHLVGSGRLPVVLLVLVWSVHNVGASVFVIQRVGGTDDMGDVIFVEDPNLRFSARRALFLEHDVLHSESVYQHLGVLTEVKSLGISPEVPGILGVFRLVPVVVVLVRASLLSVRSLLLLGCSSRGRWDLALGFKKLCQLVHALGDLRQLFPQCLNLGVDTWLVGADCVHCSSRGLEAFDLLLLLSRIQVFVRLKVLLDYRTPFAELFSPQF